ncbi:hypothetical protein B0H63DRAFT_488756 [Podospora didyma]|uniref:Uncharacterized protein n=1 Tax=Podospora didyma TaxID=330526 RepID=A0AAE0K245_9PEZI|nr:hypothetical protein B0H63DRAFT_488756 [Podospora didyma]
MSRDIDEHIAELSARDPFIGGLFRKIKNVVTGGKRDEESAELMSRDIDEHIAELSARDPFIGGLFRKIKNVVTGGKRDEESAELLSRDFEDHITNLAARDPEFAQHLEDLVTRDPSKIGNAIKGIFGSLFGRDEMGELAVEKREPEIEAHLAALEARAPGFGSFFKKLFGGGKRDEESAAILARDPEFEHHMISLVSRDPEFAHHLAALAARDPGFGSFFKKLFGGGKRDVDSAEIAAREPGIGSFFKKLFGGGKRDEDAIPVARAELGKKIGDSLVKERARKAKTSGASQNGVMYFATTGVALLMVAQIFNLAV